jgi:predicted metal-binding membrane protein
LKNDLRDTAEEVLSTSQALRVQAAVGIPAVLLFGAGVGWWWSARMAGNEMMASDAMSFAAFLLAWTAMMVAMMFPAVIPVVRLYARASAQGRAAPLPYFVAGYLVVWSAVGVPAYFAWRELMMPLEDGQTSAGVLAGVVLIGAALWQLTPLKRVCLRHCRSPLSFFFRFGRQTERPIGAVRMGLAHGGFCLGCCWALMAVLVALGTMNIAWMLAFALLIFAEKNWRWGERLAVGTAVAFLGFGITLLVDPSIMATLTS